VRVRTGFIFVKTGTNQNRVAVITVVGFSKERVICRLADRLLAPQERLFNRVKLVTAMVTADSDPERRNKQRKDEKV
jgi:hypothetical protein